MPKIYESPDGGLTIRARDFNDYDNTITIVDDGIGTYSPDVKGTITVHDPWQEQQERTMLIDKYPELKAKWEEYSELEKHYKAWDLLNNK